MAGGGRPAEGEALGTEAIRARRVRPVGILLSLVFTSLFLVANAFTFSTPGNGCIVSTRGRPATWFAGRSSIEPAQPRVVERYSFRSGATNLAILGLGIWVLLRVDPGDYADSRRAWPRATHGIRLRNLLVLTAFGLALAASLACAFCFSHQLEFEVEELMRGASLPG